MMLAFMAVLQFNCRDKMTDMKSGNICIPVTVLTGMLQDVCAAQCACYSLKSNNEKTDPVQFVFKCTTEIEVSETHCGFQPVKLDLIEAKHKLKLFNVC